MQLGFIAVPILAMAVLVCHASRSEATISARTEIDLDLRGPSPRASDECSDPPYGQCGFYADCVEARYHCGPDGYPIGYGQKYCEKFQAAQAEFSPQGQTWMLNTMKCLQDTLIPEATGAPGAVQTCEELNNKAFDSHAPCYLNSGLCSLPPRDWEVIISIVSLKTLFSSWEAVKATLETSVGCVGFYAFLALRGLL